MAFVSSELVEEKYTRLVCPVCELQYCSDIE